MIICGTRLLLMPGEKLKRLNGAFALKCVNGFSFSFVFHLFSALHEPTTESVFHFSSFSPKWFSAVHFYFSFTMTIEFQQTWHHSWQNIYRDKLMQTNVEKKRFALLLIVGFNEFWLICVPRLRCCERLAIISPIDAGWWIWHQNNNCAIVPAFEWEGRFFVY